MKKINDELGESDYPDKEQTQEEPKQPEKEIEEMENIEEHKAIEDLFKNIDKRLNRMEKAMTVVQNWLKKHSEDIGRLEDNFKLLVNKQ